MRSFPEMYNYPNVGLVSVLFAKAHAVVIKILLLTLKPKDEMN